MIRIHNISVSSYVITWMVWTCSPSCRLTASPGCTWKWTVCGCCCCWPRPSNWEQRGVGWCGSLLLGISGLYAAGTLPPHVAARRGAAHRRWVHTWTKQREMQLVKCVGSLVAHRTSGLGQRFRVRIRHLPPWFWCAAGSMPVCKNVENRRVEGGSLPRRQNFLKRKLYKGFHKKHDEFLRRWKFCHCWSWFLTKKEKEEREKVPNWACGEIYWVASSAAEPPLKNVK